jgi:predicted hotdog family 3-hydroxylacyl-ACP dehydratase
MTNTHMNPIDVNIDDLIPHRRPLRLIDEILEVAEDSAVSAAVISQQWPLLFDGAANPIVLIELVAQTAAALGGYKKKNDGAAIGGGLIVAVKSAVFFTDRIPLNSRVITRSTTRLLVENFKEITGIARIGETVVAEITLQSVSY